MNPDNPAGEDGAPETGREPARRPAPAVHRRGSRIVITGGAGFIGSNLADRLAEEGHQILVYDKLERCGVEENLAWLRERHGERIAAEIADVRDFDTLKEAVAQACEIYHLAAQVAVTTSLADPVTDFEVNARGTVNLLEALRARPSPPPLVFASTNKVYGRLDELALVEEETRYQPADPNIRDNGIDERWSLDLHSPYGCSKGAADQYVRDYARVYNLPAVVFRMSCLYGPRQFGTEDQGWVAHFLISAIARRPITIYGNGKQVRDILYVSDAVNAYRLAQARMGRLTGRIFNLGGGAGNAVSLLDVLGLITRIQNREPLIEFGPWRPGDQAYYVSDTSAFRAATGWRPGIDAETGIHRLFDWLRRRSAPRSMEELPA
jgi:CDP-paratose 2-epimerase